MGGVSSTRAKCEAEREAEWKLFIEEQQRKLKEREDALQRDQEKLNQVLDVKKEIETRRDCVKGYKPGESMEFSDLTFPDILNVGLFGTTGIGKTSLLNSLKYAVNGELKELHREQVAPADYQGGHTVRRLAVRLTKHIAFIDNRGVGAEDLGAPGNTEEMISQLEGRSSFAQPIVWREENPVNKLNTTKRHHRNRIYCAVLVFDARKSKAYFEVASKFVDCLFKWQAFTMSTSSDDDTIDLGVLNDYVEQALPSLSVSARSDVIDKLLRLGVGTPSDLHFLDEDDLKSLKKIHVRKLLQASTKGRFPIAVVTNVDRASDEDLDNMYLVLGSTGITDIYKVANISPDKEHLEDEWQLSLLKLIEKCVGDGDRIFELRTQIENEEQEEVETSNGAQNY